MRSQKLQLQLSEQLGSEQIDSDLSEVIAWAQQHSSEGEAAQKNAQLVAKLANFLEVVDGSYKEFEAYSNDNETEKERFKPTSEKSQTS